jgi:iron complex outermembrane receptor protein
MGSTAAQAQAPGEASAEKVGIEEVIVTARRRAETLQTYAGTASVFNANALEEARVDGLEDIVNRIPNAYFEERPGGAINIFIRGAGTATNGSATQTDTAVGLYMDGIYSYLQGSRIPLVFYDLDRVEVFKGPQGSLYGRNSVGGAVVAYTARPTHEFESYVSLQRAEYDSTTAEGRLNIPLGEAFALRLSGYYDDADSYFTNLNPDREEAGNRSASGRARLRFEPSETLDIVLGYERMDEDKGPQIIVPERFAVDERLISVSDTNSHIERVTDRILATVDWEFTPGVELRTISGYTELDSNGRFDQNNLQRGPAPALLPFIGIQADRLEGSQMMQEVMFASTGEGPFEWLVGASYFEDEQEGGATIQSGLLGSAAGVITSRSNFESSTEMWAAFMDVSYRFWEKVVLEGSLRYSDERREARRSNATIINPATGTPFPPSAFQFENEYSRLSPGGALSVEWTESFMT